MVPIASILTDATTGVGLMAATIAVGGFLAHAKPAIEGKSEQAIRQATVIGGLFGFGAASFILLASWFG